MSKKHIENIKYLAQSMDWDDLALVIIELSQDLVELTKNTDKKKFKYLFEELQVFEITKQNMVERLSINSPSTPLTYGEDYVSVYNDDDDLY